MFRFLAANWLTRRVAGPISRAIPNPFLRAAAIAGVGVLATRLFQKRRPEMSYGTRDWRAARH